MERSPHLTFGSFRLDTEEKRVWRGERQLPLRPPCVSVLQMLVENANEILTREQILRHVWPGKYPTIVALRVCIHEIRQALGDDQKSPQYIETVGHKGYRYIGSMVEGKTALIQRETSKGFEHIVGREDELEQLDKWFGKARRYLRQIVFVTGEPGIGKTTLVEMFLARLRTDRRVRIGRGQCLEQYGEGEPYLPILEAFGRLCSDPGGAPIKALLSRCAPTWVIQMSGLLSSEEITSLQQRIQGANQQRMLREMADALEALTNENIFVLVLEDLHWSDYSTLELLAYLAQRQERIQLMVIGTYRPADLTTGHPLKKIKREMQVRRQCEELSLALLRKEEVATYVAERLPPNVLSPELIDLIHHRTEGNALFMVNMVNMLHEQMVEQDGQWELPVNVEDLRMPESLRQVIEEKFERLSADDRQILEAASAEGREFSCAAIAMATNRDPLEIEERCADLMRQSQFIQETEICTWPDGAVTARYEFIHVLYHEVFYSRLTPGRRAQFHLRTGERLEQGYCDRTGEIAAELALHFERGRDFHRAVLYLQQAAEQATRRFAYPECIRYLTRALGLLQTFTDTPERKQFELRCQIDLGVALMTTKGYADPEAKQAYDRARELCQQIGQTPQLVPVLRGLAAFYYVRAELAIARDLGEQLLQVVQEENDPALLLEAHQELGGTLSSMGEFTSALQHLERGIRLYDPQKHHEHAVLYGQDPGVSCLCRASLALWCLGYQTQALTKVQDAVALAQKLSHPYSLTYSLSFAGIVHQLRQEQQLTLECATDTIQLATKQEFPIWKTVGQILRGWGIAVLKQSKEGISLIQQGIASWRAAGSEISVPSFLYLLAETYKENGAPQKGLQVVTEAIEVADSTGDCWWEAELYRLRGELTLRQAEIQSLESQDKKTPEPKDQPPSSKNTDLRALAPDPQSEAEEYFQRALAIARRQRAKSLELRAAMSLARLWQCQGKEFEAWQLLSCIYDWFREGFDTVDLQQAKAFLAELHVGVAEKP